MLTLFKIRAKMLYYKISINLINIMKLNNKILIPVLIFSLFASNLLSLGTAEAKTKKSKFNRRPKQEILLSVTNPTKRVDVLAGTNRQLLTNITLDASNSIEDIRVEKIKFYHRVKKGAKRSYITNLVIYDSSTLISNAIDGSSKQIVITLDPALVIPKGTSKIISLKGDISGSIKVNSVHRFNTLKNGIKAYGEISNKRVKVKRVSSLKGMLVKTVYGDFKVFTGPNNPATKTYLANSTGNTIGFMNFQSSLEDVGIQQMYFNIDGYNNCNAYMIDKLALYDGTTKIAEGFATSSENILLNSHNNLFVIPKGVSKTMTLKADFSPINTYGSVTSGDGIKLTLNNTGITVRGLSTGDIYNQSSKSGSYETNKIYLFKSLPTVFRNNLPTGSLNNGVEELYNFSVIAEATGDVAWYKMTFDVEIEGDIQVSNFQLYNNGSLISLASTTASGLIEFYPYYSSYEQVQAGTSKTYQIMADVVKTSNNYSISITHLGDGGNEVLAPQTAFTIDNQVDNNFIWSDLYYGNSSSTAPITKEWFNGRLINYFNTTQVFGYNSGSGGGGHGPGGY